MLKFFSVVGANGRGCAQRARKRKPMLKIGKMCRSLFTKVKAGMFSALASGLLLAPGLLPAQPLRVVTTLNSVYDNQEGVAGKSRSFTRWPIYIGSADAAELVLSTNGW